jgi:hypothetical protein
MADRAVGAARFTARYRNAVSCCEQLSASSDFAEMMAYSPMSILYWI